MDCERYYKIEKDGVFNVHFLNTNGYNVDQIRNIFSPYGKVITVNVSGDDYGLRFVKYQTLNETIRCIQALKNSKFIQLLPEKSKINININKTLAENDSNQWQESKELVAKKEHSVNVDKQFTSHFNNTDSKVNYKLTGNLETSDQENRSDKAQAHLNVSPQTNNIMNQNKWWTNLSSSEKPNLSDSNKQLSPSSEQQNFMDKNSSHTTINFTKYYRATKDACYTLHFLKNDLTSDEIKELFSSYGNVLNIYNNDNGFVFVKYKTVTEIENCLKNLLHNNIINILPQKDKINGTIKRTDQHISKKSSTVKTQINSNFSYNKTSETGYQSYFNMKSNPGNRFERNADIFSNNNPRNVKHASTNNVNVANDDKLIPVSSEKYESSKREDFINDKLVYNQGQSNICSNDHLVSSIRSHSSVKTNIYDNSKIPDLISDTEEIKQKEIYNIAEKSVTMLMQKEFYNIAEKSIAMPMQEVIVGNIPVNYSMFYILHLFEKYNPIGGVSVKTISETDIRYCYVYFKTVQNAAAVEREFDGFVLAGKSLIVLQKSNLIEEARK